MAVVKGIFRKDREHQWRECGEILLEDMEKESHNREISLITVDGYEKLIKDQVKGFCHNKFKANLIIEGLDIHKIIYGSLLSIGQVVIQITKVGKDCHKECPALADNKICTLKQHIFFATTKKPGKIQVHTKVNL